MARTVKLDMTGVESYSKASEGIHTAKVAEIVEKTSQGGDPMLQFAFEIIKGDDKGCKVFESFSLNDKALWKLKSCLQAIGMKADGKIKLDLDKLIGKVCDIEVFWDEYNGQTRAKISDFYKAGKGGGANAESDTDEDEDDDDEEETPKKKAPSKKSKAKKPEPEDEDEEDDEDDDEDEDEEPAPKKKSKKEPVKKGAAKKSKKKPEPEPEEDEDDDDDEDWEEDD